MGTCVCVGVCRGPKLTLRVLLSSFFTLDIESGSLLERELTMLVSLAREFPCLASCASSMGGHYTHSAFTGFPLTWVLEI